MNTLTKTPSTIKEDENFLCGLELKELGLNVYLSYQGSDKVAYDAFLNGEMLFTGNDFRPSPLHNIDDLQSAVSILIFLSAAPGDINKEYFANYTEKQKNWSKSFDCELLKAKISDYDTPNSEYYEEAKKYFESQFII